MDAQKQSFSGQKIKFKNLPTTMLALSCRGSSKISENSENYLTVANLLQIILMY